MTSPTEPSRLRYFCGMCISVIILYVCNVIREMPIYFPILLVRSPAIGFPDVSHQDEKRPLTHF